MNLAMIGTGYVGLTSALGFSQMGNSVICVDLDESKIKNLKKGILPFYEPGLEEMLNQNQKENRLYFTTNTEESIQKSDLIFIAVGTPTHPEDGSVDLRALFSATQEIGHGIRKEQNSTKQNKKKYLVIKSTVPVGTFRKVKKQLQEILDDPSYVEVISNPEFLREGSALQDFMKPDRIILGLESLSAKRAMESLYSPFTRNRNRLIFMSPESAELCKYSANAMLATRISFMNEFSKLCELWGADIEEIRYGIGSDPRIASHFLYAGLGFGGSCLPKDLRALLHNAPKNSLPILEAVYQTNQDMREKFFQKILNRFGSLKDHKIAVWGLSYKAETDDLREAPSIDIIQNLLRHQADVHAFDPISILKTKDFIPEDPHLFYAEDSQTVLDQADALCILTDWKSFRNANLAEMKKSMKQAIIFDGRNQYDPQTLKDAGFEYHCIGRGTFQKEN